MEQRDFPEIVKEVTISETLSKTLLIPIKHYLYNGVYKDDDGHAEIDADFSDTNWLEEYNYGNYTIENLLGVCKEFIRDLYPFLNPKKQPVARYLISQLSNWYQDDVEVTPE